MKRPILSPRSCNPAGFRCEAQVSVSNAESLRPSMTHCSLNWRVRPLSLHQARSKSPRRHPGLASGDFAFMMQAVPGCYFWLGAARPGDNPSLHSPGYDFSDELVRLGAGFFTHSRPLMRPMPATIPAAGTSFSYIPFAARGASSRKGVPGSRRASIRSRAVNFPRGRCFRRSFREAPTRANAWIRHLPRMRRSLRRSCS